MNQALVTATIEKYKSTINSLNLQMSINKQNVENIITAKDETIKNLQDENQLLKNENQLLKNENQTLKNENQTLKNENQTLKNENQTLKNENQLLKDENQQLKSPPKFVIYK
jgi:hypothetical protein